MICDFLEFFVFHCLDLFLERPVLGAALTRQIPSPLLPLLPQAMTPSYALFPLFRLSPLPLPVLYNPLSFSTHEQPECWPPLFFVMISR